MESTCDEVLKRCFDREACSDELLDRALAEDEGRTFLSVVVERLGDLFEPRLCAVYEELFARVIARIAPSLKDRIGRRDPGQKPGGSLKGRPHVYVLSRVTIGADVAVTSVLLDAAKRRFPEAEICFVAPRKNYELFGADPRIRHIDAPYARTGALIDRLRASASLWFDDGLVIDPDSRLSQLGVIRVCPEENYLWFNSRAYGGDSEARLPDLAARWACETLGVDEARPFIEPLAPTEAPADVTVSLGVGENQDKRIPGEFERDLLEILARTGASVLVDQGGSEEEAARVRSILPSGMRTHHGAFAPFAAQIARSRLFVGYDSAGGHVASACGIPQIAVMKGFVSERMLARWRPNGVLIRADAKPPNEVLQEVESAAFDILTTARRLL